MSSHTTSNPNMPAAGQVWDADAYASNANFVPALGNAVFDLLAPCPDENILDLGCGDGVLTKRIAEAGANVTGLEPSPELAARARKLGLNIQEADSHDPFGQDCFDAIFSNAAFHWLQDPQKVIQNASTALTNGGRLVVEQGGWGNVAAIVTAIHAALEAAGLSERAKSPWDFPSITTQKNRLETAGFQVEFIQLIPRPTPLATGIQGWLKTFAGPYLIGLPQSLQNEICADAARRLTLLYDPEEGWMADYVRLRFLARKP